MKLARLLLFALIMAALNSYPATQGEARQTQQVPADDSSPLGDWSGESVFVVRDSACRDEDSLYHVTKLAGKPGWFSMKLDNNCRRQAVDHAHGAVQLRFCEA